MVHARRKGKNTAEILMSVTIGSCSNTHEVRSTYARASTYAGYTANTCIVLKIPKQRALHRSLLVALWEWFVGKVGELTHWWANNHRKSKNTFSGSHRLSVWLIAPGMSSDDWRLSNLHPVTWWQLEAHDAIRTAHEHDKAVVHPSVVFLYWKKKTPIVPGNEQRTHLPKKSCAANTYVFLVVFSFASDRFSTASATAAVLVVLWEEWRGGGNRAIKEAPDSGIRQQKTDLNWDLQQRGGKRRRPCGPHACLSSPASSHQPLWVSLALQSLCVCVCIHVTCADAGAKTHLLYFVTCVVWGCITISSFCYLGARVCQTTVMKASDISSLRCLSRSSH